MGESATREDLWFMEYAAVLTKVYNLCCRWAGKWHTTYQNLLILMELCSSPEGREAGELADCLHLPRQTMTYMLDSMEKEGYLLRRGNPADRRRKLLLLTEQGERMVREVMEEWGKAFEEFSGRLSKNRETLLTEVRDLLLILEAKLPLTEQKERGKKR